MNFGVWPERGPFGGRYYPMTGDGYLCNRWDATPIQAEWRTVVDDATRSASRLLGSQLDSLYLRGSVAEGRARVTTSDVDFVAIVRAGARDCLSALAEELHGRHQIAREVSFETCTLSELRESRQFRYMRVVLRAQCRYLAGTDRRPELEPARPGWPMVFAAHTLGARFLRFRALRAECVDSITIDRRTQSFFRAALRSGFELYEAEIGRYTRDIDLCAEVLAVASPERRSLFESMWQRALRPAHDDDLLVATQFIDWFGPTRERRMMEAGL